MKFVLERTGSHHGRRTLIAAAHHVDLGDLGTALPAAADRHRGLSGLEKVRAALDSLTLAGDGVAGASVYVYGEGWNFGEVADNARFQQATQLEMFGAGIGTFNDRLRDGVRGGGPFDDDPRLQGFGSGLFSDPNESPENGTPDEQRARLLQHQDMIKVGLTGNLRDYEFVDHTGADITGAEVDYNGSPAGYTADPAEVITYVDAHDNETLFDALTYKLPPATPMDARVRMNTLSLATVTLSQGPSFWHAGADLLRSKSLDRNSYDSGDWFNRIDWTGASNTFGSGLPPAPADRIRRPASSSCRSTTGPVPTSTRTASGLSSCSTRRPRPRPSSWTTRRRSTCMTSRRAGPMTSCKRRR